MSFIVCMSVLGVLLMLLALTSSYLRWMPVTTSAVCLAFGFGIGPLGLDIINLDFKQSREWLECLTEVAVLFSLFGTGIKLRLPLNCKAWHSAYWLAGPVMLATIAGVSVAAHYIFGI
ncbi:sodium:proton antiporter, partial [Pseudomonas syringae pv. actinidiae]|nr:sodium:proton antiporter [Pseudomonas syringae pv. actinidiae]